MAINQIPIGRQNRGVEDAPTLHTLKRRLDEPKLDLGDMVDLKEGERGIVVARYTPSSHPNEIRYVVRAESQEHRKHKR
jgi:hypothetical protein